MCRVLAYLGPERPLKELLLDPPHSLEVQSYAPKEMEEALLNADGFGVAWYADGVAEPARYRTILPMWADENVRDFAAQVRSRCVIAAVRSATPGIGHGLANTQPFVHGRLTFLHNGFIRGFRDGPMRSIRAGLGDEAYKSIRGTSDSEHLFALFLDAYLAQGELEGALEATLARADAARAGQRALLSLIVSDGAKVCAVTQAFDGNAPTLYRREEEGATLFASEPLFVDDRWETLEPGKVVTAS
jgi:ergothioneine biosynthesis protein EgtC